MWSPDGTRLAYASHRDNVNEVYVASVRDGTETRLTRSDGSVPGAWSPDGGSLAVIRVRPSASYRPTAATSRPCYA